MNSDELLRKLTRLGYCKGQVPSVDLSAMIRKASWADVRKPARIYRWRTNYTVLLVGDDWLAVEAPDKEVLVQHVNWNKRILKFSYPLGEII